MTIVGLLSCGDSYTLIHTMNAFTDPLVQRFLSLCATHDPQLRQAIASVQIIAYPDGLIALLYETPQRPIRLWRFMVVIAKILHCVGAFKAIEVKTELKLMHFKVSDLLMMTDVDLAASSSARQPWTDASFDALANHKTRDCHVFILGLDGIYIDARLQRDSPATITPEQMIGNPIADFIGAAEATVLLAQLTAAYEQGVERDLEYQVRHPNGEARRYHGTIVPIPDRMACLLLSNRVKQTSETRSLTAPG